MDIVKKNILSIIIGVIALIAVIALFWPVSGYFEQQQADAEERAEDYATLVGLTDKTRYQPGVDPDKAEPEPLGMFPTQQVIDQGNAAKTLVEQQSNKMLQVAVQLNKHELLIPGSLPAPNVPQRLNFREKYRMEAEKKIFAEILRAGMPPTPEEVELAKTDLWERQFQADVAVRGDQIVRALFDEQAATLRDQLWQQKAQSIGVYANPVTFTWNPNIAGSGSPAPLHVWFAQMGVWIQEDVAKAVQAANSASSNVIQAPVKRIVQITLPDHTAMYVREPGVSANSSTGVLPKSTLLSSTGRICNGLYDVVHFTVVLHVEAESIPRVLQEISRNQFVNVLDAQVESLDSAVAAMAGFLYGSKPIANITLNCEALFLREWTVPLMPAAVRSLLGIQPQPAGTASGI